MVLFKSKFTIKINIFTNKIYFILCLIFLLSACNQKKEVPGIIVKNPISDSLKGITFPIKGTADMQLISAIPLSLLTFMDGDKEVPYQRISSKDEGTYYLLQSDFAPNEVKKIIVKRGPLKKYIKHTQSILNVKEGGNWFWEENKDTGKKQYIYRGGVWSKVNSLWVDSKHDINSLDIRYEGPVWESDKIAYRFYLDRRNATDIFGKRTDTLVMQSVGKKFETYDSMSDWGMDILSVGNSLGIGSLGYWANSRANGLSKVARTNCSIDYSGTLKSKLTTSYYYWQYNDGTTDIFSEFSICAGSYLTKAHIYSTEKIDNLCTGFVRNEEGKLITSSDSTGEWSYIGSFGKQSVINDNLGLAIFYKTKDLIDLKEDSLNHVVILKPENRELTYYFCGIWEQDSSQINSVEQFEKFMKKQKLLLDAHLID